MFVFNEEDERVVAVLHDVVEDTDLTLDDLRREGFPEKTINAVDALTMRSEEDYLKEYLRRVARNELARKVKIADLKDNIDLSRISNPTLRDVERYNKYENALFFLGYCFTEW